MGDDGVCMMNWMRTRDHDAAATTTAAAVWLFLLHAAG
jgi:hypothetical protein